MNNKSRDIDAVITETIRLDPPRYLWEVYYSDVLQDYIYGDSDVEKPEWLGRNTTTFKTVKEAALAAKRDYDVKTYWQYHHGKYREFKIHVAEWVETVS